MCTGTHHIPGIFIVPRPKFLLLAKYRHDRPTEHDRVKHTTQGVGTYRIPGVPHGIVAEFYFLIFLTATIARPARDMSRRTSAKQRRLSRDAAAGLTPEERNSFMDIVMEEAEGAVGLTTEPPNHRQRAVIETSKRIQEARDPRRKNPRLTSRRREAETSGKMRFVQTLQKTTTPRGARSQHPQRHSQT